MGKVKEDGTVIGKTKSGQARIKMIQYFNNQFQRNNTKLEKYVEKKLTLNVNKRRGKIRVS